MNYQHPTDYLVYLATVYAIPVTVLVISTWKLARRRSPIIDPNEEVRNTIETELITQIAENAGPALAPLWYHPVYLCYGGAVLAGTKP